MDRNTNENKTTSEFLSKFVGDTFANTVKSKKVTYLPRIIDTSIIATENTMSLGMNSGMSPKLKSPYFMPESFVKITQDIESEAVDFVNYKVRCFYDNNDEDDAPNDESCSQSVSHN